MVYYRTKVLLGQAIPHDDILSTISPFIHQTIPGKG
jgi:hypothetical protein